MHLRTIHVFRFTKYAHIAEILTLNDVLYWGGDAFASVVLALFATSYLEGGTVSSIGIAYMIYRLVSSISTVYIGKTLDKNKGYFDEIWVLFIACAIAGLTYMMLSFATQIWHLYIAMGVLGLCRALDINSWKILFYSHIESDLKGRTIGTYDAIVGITLGAMAALAGFIGEQYGFRVVIFAAGLLIFLSSIPVLSLRSEKSL